MDTPTDPVRELILKKSRQLGVPLSEISRAAGRNDAYMHQFVHRKSPKYLPEDVRGVVSQILDILEEDLKIPLPSQLRGRQPAARIVDTTYEDVPATPQLPGPIPAQARADLPVFIEGDQLNLDSPRERTPCPPYLQGIAGAFGVWVEVAAGRLRPGDLAYVRPNQPPRVGDSAAVVQDGRIIMLGELVKTESGRVTLSQDDVEPQEFDRADIDLMKVVGTYIA